MIRRAIFAVAALALLVPAAAHADGVSFGFAGGTLAFNGSTLTTGVLPTFTDVTRIPGGTTFLGDFGTVAFTTGGATGGTPSGTDLFFATGGAFVITSNASFGVTVSNNSGGTITIPAGTTIFNGQFSDITTSAFLGPVSLPAAFSQAPGGTGAIWSSLSTCPPWAAPGSTCSRLVGALSGQLDPGLLAWLGLTGTTANGWVAQIDFTSNGQVFNITFGDSQVYVPEPGTLLLFGTGLMAIAGVLRRKIVA